MNTLWIPIPDPGCKQAIEQAAALLRRGGLVAIPTETVYGLAANALDAHAVAQIFAAKGRPQDNPLIVHISETAQMERYVRRLDPRALLLAQAFWPGPLTIIQQKAACIPDIVSAGLDSVALRLPAHPVARALIAAAGVPLAAPSANRSGRPSPTTAEHVRKDMDGRIDAIVDGGKSEVGVESTVLSLLGETPRLLRPGGVSHRQLEQLLGQVEIDSAVGAKPAEDAPVHSPGMKYRHYAPKATVILLRGDLERFLHYVKEQPEGKGVLCFAEDAVPPELPCIRYGGIARPEEQARLLFAALREADDRGIQTLFVRAPEQSGDSLAVYNRLLRAAAFREVTV